MALSRLFLNVKPEIRASNLWDKRLQALPSVRRLATASSAVS
jgi:hypothetical protein